MNTIQLQNEQSVNVSEIEISLESIQIDYSILPRDGVDEKQVAILEDQINLLDRNGDNPHLDPIHVFEIDGEYILARGLHRYHAYKKFAENVNGEFLVSVSLITGSKEDLIAHACTAGKGEKPLKGYSRKEKRMMVRNYLQLPHNRPPLKSFNQLSKELGIVTDKTIKEVWEVAIEQPDGSLRFEEKSNILSFPKQKQKPAEGFAPETENENGSQSSEFRSQEDYYDEDHSSEQSERSPSLPNTPTRIKDVRPERERLQAEIEELKKEIAQDKKELAMLNVVRNERDDYKKRLLEMTAIADQQNNTVPLLEEIDKLNAQIKELSDENKKLKSQPLSEVESETQEETEKPKPSPVTENVMKEMAQGCLLLAQRMGSTAIATRIESLIEKNFSPELLQEVLSVSEAEKIKEIEAERDRLLERLNQKNEEVREDQDNKFLLDNKDQEIAKLSSELKIKNKQLEDLYKKFEERGCEDKVLRLAQEIDNMGGIKTVKEMVQKSTLIPGLTAQIDGFGKIKTALRTIANACEWSDGEVKSLCAGETKLIDDLKERITSGLPKNPNKAIELIKQSGATFNKLIEKVFISLGEGITNNLVVEFQSNKGSLTSISSEGLTIDSGAFLPWLGFYKGYAKFELLQF